MPFGVAGIGCFGVVYLCENSIADSFWRFILSFRWNDNAVRALVYRAADIVSKTRAICGRILQILSCILFPVCGMAVAGILFYRLKCKVPIEILEESVKRIQNQDLDFHIPKVSEDELGQLCAAFETMRDELLQSNQELWRQAEERKRLNAAFSHDLRNPVTVLKGTVKMLRKQQGACDLQALERLENYTLRIEQYVEAMSSIQRLEQYPVKKKRIDGVALTADLIQTANLLAPQLSISVRDCGIGSVILDYGLFMIVAENLIGNAARFAQKEIDISLEKMELFLRCRSLMMEQDFRCPYCRTAQSLLEK